MNSNRTQEDDLARDALVEFLSRRPDADTFLTYRHYRVPAFVIDEGSEGFRVVQVGYKANGGVTLCVVAEPDSEKLHVTVAECSDRDLFNKNIAREISFGRFYRVGDFVTINWNRDFTISENLESNWELFGIRKDYEDLVLSVKNRFIED